MSSDERNRTVSSSKEEDDDELPMPPIFRTESEVRSSTLPLFIKRRAPSLLVPIYQYIPTTQIKMLKYALKLSLESAAESTTIKNDEEKEKKTLPSLTRTVSSLPSPPSISTSSYSMKKTVSENKEEDAVVEPTRKVFSFYRSQSIASQETATDNEVSNTSVFVWGQNDYIVLPLFPDDRHRYSPTLVSSLSSLKLIDLELYQDRLLGITHEGLIVGMGNNDEYQILNDSADVIRAPRVVNVAVESGAHRVTCDSKISALVTREGEVFTWGKGKDEKGSTLKISQDRRAWQVCCCSSNTTRILHVLTEDGDVLCSETNIWATNPSPLSLVSGLSSLPVVWISSGQSHTVAVTQEGLVFGWGYVLLLLQTLLFFLKYENDIPIIYTDLLTLVFEPPSARSPFKSKDWTESYL